MRKLHGPLLIALLLSGCQSPSDAPFDSGAQLPGANAVAVGYVNGDGYLDLLLAHDGGATIMQGDGDSFQRNGFLTCADCNLVHIAIGELNEDDQEDFLFLSPTALRPYLNLGNGYRPLTPIPIEPARSMALVDVNNDGFLDATIHHEDGAISLLLNSPTGFDAPVPIAGDATGFSYFLHDDDLFLDLAAATPSGIVVHPNGATLDGNWTGFNDPLAPVGPPAAQALVPIDVDNDQRMDLAVTGPEGSAILRNTGRDLEAQELPVGAAKWIVPMDVNNDGREDLVVGGSTMQLLTNDGSWKSQSFGAAKDLVATGDWNRDGRVDLATFDQQGGQLHSNNGELNHYLSLRLRGNESNDSGIGIKTTLTTGHSLLLRQSGGIGSPAVAAAPGVHFGLGSELAGSYALAILWPSGILQFDQAEEPAEIVDRHTIARESRKDAPWDGC